MSTRRARIKAVAALPPRRRNLENVDAKIKQKEHFEQIVKSPRTPRNVRKKSEDSKAPAGNYIWSPPDLLPINEAKSPAPNKVPSPEPTVISLDSEKLSNTPSSEVTSVLTTSPQRVTFTRSAYAALAKKKATADQLALLSPQLASVETKLKSVTPSQAPAGLEINDNIVPNDAEEDTIPSGAKKVRTQITEKNSTPSQEEKNTSQITEKDTTPSRKKKKTSQDTEKCSTPSREKKNTRQNAENQTHNKHPPSGGKNKTSQITDIDITPSGQKRNTRQNSEKNASPSVGQKNTSQITEKDTTLIGKEKTTRQYSENLGALSGDNEDRSQITAKDDVLCEKVKRAIQISEKDTTPIREKKDSIHNTEKDVTPGVGQKNDLPDDYSVPSVPESVTEEAMDGIVPLQTARSAPKPIDLLKNDIISDHAEVSFDPIVPLPSPSKVRPKLRPVPRLAPHRRNSVQGSASESEDDSRRTLLSGGATSAPPRQRHDSHTSASHSGIQHTAPHKEINRVRNDSISSSVSQAATQVPPATSPVKDKHLSSKARRPELSRRGWYRHRKDAKRETLTMYDLIFYNPTTNPIVPDEDEISAKEANAKAEAERKREEVIAKESEEDADDPPTDAAPVPQIKLGPNGEIVLDETSLVIKQSDNRRVSSVVREGPWAGGGGRYTRAARTADWSAPETVRFYRALAAVGTDFTLMAHLFPTRSRRDLYLKFKKEERHNGAQVDKALRSATAWDPEHLQEEFTKEREEAAKQIEDERKRLLQKKEEERERLKSLKDMKLRYSRGSKALESAMVLDHSPTELTGDEFLRRALAERKNRKRKKEDPEFILPTTTPKIPIPRLAKAQPSQFATLTLLGAPATTHAANTSGQGKRNADMATISRIENVPTAPSIKSVNVNEVSGVPNNIESGSLVVLRVNDPKDSSKTMLQTYIASGSGKLTPVALPPTFLNSVVGYMKKDGSKGSASSSPQLTSPGSVASDSRSGTPGVIQLNPSPNKRQRHSSYSITSL